MTVAQAGWYASGFYPQGFLKIYGERISDFQLPHDAKIRDLSKGMRAKVALSLALAFDPELLILDEPTSGLDPLVRRSFLESMIDRAAAGQTVFLSSHQIQEVERVADWVAILHQGSLQIVAPLDELKSSISILDFSQRDPLLAMPAELDQVEVLHKSQIGRSFHLMVRGLTPEIVSSLSQNANLFEVKSIRPNLEELYLGFTQPFEPRLNGDGLGQHVQNAKNSEVA
jgi:ABC-2 type transport system ATP-binding protein